MNLRSWMMLVFLLSAGTSLADVDVNWLTRTVQAIRAEYRINGQFCLAANIPLNGDQNALGNALQNDRYSRNLKDTIDGYMLYQGHNVIIAKEASVKHAEPLVLKKLRTLSQNSQGKFLLIYSYLSPCGDKCANPDNQYNILRYLRKDKLAYWSNYAFVFTRVFDQPKSNKDPPPTEEDLEEALTHLGDSGLGLDHIFRCFGDNTELQCHSCSSQGEVSNVCINNNWPQGGGSSRSRSSSSSSGRSSGSRSRSGSSSNISKKRPRYRRKSESSSSYNRGQGRRRSSG